MSTASVAGSYRGLFAKPVLRRLAVADACARLPQGMVSLTVLLVAAEHASMMVAGLAVAGYTFGQAVTGPVRGRLADRRGLIPVAVACGTCYALALLGLLGSALTGARASVLIGAAAAAGLAQLHHERRGGRRGCPGRSRGGPPRARAGPGRRRGRGRRGQRRTR